MGALIRVAPQSGIAAMQVINNAVVYPIFFLLFFGTAFLSAAIIGASPLGSVGSGAVLAVGGGAAYLVCIIGVTIIFNVPMNNALALVGRQRRKAPLPRRITWSNGPGGTM